MRALLPGSLLVLALLFTAGIAAAQPMTTAQARARFQAGRAAYEAGDYVTAVREFEAAQRLRPSPLLTYNMARAHERRGDWRAAATLYRRYLQELPLAEDRLGVAARVQELEQLAVRLAPPAAANALPPLREVAGAPRTSPAVAAPGALVDVAPARIRQLQWTWVAAGTTLASVVAASASSGLFVARRSDMRSGCGQTEAGCSAATIDGLQTRATAANSLWGIAAAAAAATGLVLWLELRATRRRVVFAPTPGGLALRGHY